MRGVVSLLVIVIGLAMGGAASAAPKKVAACTSPLSCARACSVRNVAACERVADALLDTLLSIDSRSPDHHGWFPAETATVARQTLPSVCAAGNHRACLLLGELEEIGLGGPADKPSALRRYTAGCDRGHGAACYALAHGQGSGSWEPVPSKTFVQTFQRSCASGFAGGCAVSGLATAQGLGVEKDRTRGIAQATEACEQRRDALACLWLGFAHRNGVFGDADQARAAAAYELACSLGSAIACATRAEQEADKAVAWQYNEKACANGHGALCDLLAPKAPNHQTAVALQETGCRFHDPDSCLWLAVAHRDGTRGLTRDIKRARSYAARSCDAAGPRACVEATLLEVKDPTRRDGAIASAVAMCDGGSAIACRRLAVGFHHGRFGPPDLARARSLFQAECNLTGEAPCADADTVSTEIAHANNRAACDGGDLAACERFVAVGDIDVASLPLLEKACQAQVRGACLLRDQSAFAVDRDQGRVRSSIVACDAGELDACRFVEASSDDPAAQLAAQVVLCRGDDAASCEAVAHAARHEDDDLSRALELYRKACKLDADLESCDDIEDFEEQLAEQRVEQQHEDEATACERGDVAACTAIGHRTDEPEDALVIWDRACAQRDPHACYHSGELRAEDDPERARVDLTIACNGAGHDDACPALAALPAPAPAPTVEVAATSSSVEASTYASAPSTDSGERISAGALAEVRLGHYSFDVPGELMLPGTSGLQVSTAFAPALGRRVAVFAPMSSILSIGGEGDLDVDTSAGVGLELRGRRAALAASVVGGYGLLSSEAAAWAGVDSSLYLGGEVRGRVRAGTLGLAGRATSLARGDVNELRLEGVLEYRGRDRTFGVGATFTEYGDRLSSTAFFLAVSR
jgi:TPR repeat protein